MSNHKNTRRLLACAVAALALAGPTTSTGALADPGPATPTNDDEAIQMDGLTSTQLLALAGHPDKR